MSKAHRILLIPILVLIFAAPAFADPVVTVDNQLRLTITGIQGAVTDTQVLQFLFQPTPSGFWSAGMTVTLHNADLNNPNDTIQILGVAQHVMSPAGHNDGAGPPITFNIAVNAANAVGGVVVAPAVFTVAAHGPNGHLDLLTVTLQATVLPAGVLNQITGWTVTVDVVHTPEPATMTLLGIGLTGVALKIRRRCKSKKIS